MIGIRLESLINTTTSHFDEGIKKTDALKDLLRDMEKKLKQERIN